MRAKRANLKTRVRFLGPVHTKRSLVLLSVVIGLIITALLNEGWFLQQYNYYTLSQSNISKSEDVALSSNSLLSEISIPSIKVRAPIVDNQPKTDGIAVKNALQAGVLLYGDSAPPGQAGNVVIVGHSSGSALNPGAYKWVFTLLDKLKPGDNIIMHYAGDTFLYTVDDTKIVKPDDTSVLSDTSQARLTLITCTPVGTNTKRLVVSAHLKNSHAGLSYIQPY